VSSSYRFSGPFVIRLMGLCLVLAGILVVVLALLVALTPLPGLVLVIGAVVVVVATMLVALAARRGWVVRFDDTGYRVRFVRGAGVHQATWPQVEDVATTTVAGEKCVLLRLRDGRTTTCAATSIHGSSAAPGSLCGLRASTARARWRCRLVAYGARLLSGLRVTPSRGFKSRHLRQSPAGSGRSSRA
jgi:hypothetical protein